VDNAMTVKFGDIVPDVVVADHEGRPWLASAMLGIRPSSHNQWAVYRDSSLTIEHRLDEIAGVQRYGPSQPASDDNVSGLDVPTLLGQLADQPDNTRRRMT
jgi:hypothetical protein